MNLGNLTVHMRSHNGATPYHCNICPKKFPNINGLNRHVLIHQQKNETNAAIEEILEAPIIEIPHHFDGNANLKSLEPQIVEQTVFENVTPFNFNSQTIQFIPPI